MKYNKVMLEEIERDILNAKYEQAAKKFKNMNNEEIHDIIWFNIVDRLKSLSVYGFTQYMFKKTENTIWLSLSVVIMSFTLCWMEGAYAVGIFHARELVSLEKNIDNLILLLSFYGLPERLMKEEEAESISKEILQLDKNNEIALNVLNEVSKSK
ncbi:hypothetical protein [Leptotrichia hongkongensis]|uniref:hypothetical protein n=1 Tax=Leptotrichia hongkongensis TaxID=554406 RepID=UPI0035A8A282